MSRGLREIVYGGGDQELIHLPPLRVASATYYVEDLHEDEDGTDREIVSPTAATVDSFSTTTDAACGRDSSDPRLVPVTDESGATVGNHVQVSSFAGTETRKIEASDTGQLRVNRPLHVAHPSGATVQGIEVSGTFPSASAANDDLFEQNRVLEVTWVYTLQGEVVYASEQIRMVRRRWRYAVSGDVESTLRATHSSLVQQLEPYGGNLREVIEDAADEIVWKLSQRGLPVSQYMTGRTGFRLVKAKALELIAENGIHPPNFDPQSYLDHMAGHVARAMNALHGKQPLDTADIDRESDTVAANRSKRLYGGVRRA